MKSIIAGGRDFIPNERHREWLIFQLERNNVTEVFSGCAKGADSFGEDVASDLRIPTRLFPADWGTHGKAAGPIRNEEMAKEADICILFPGGTGTADMRRRSIQHGLMLIEYKEI